MYFFRFLVLGGASLNPIAFACWSGIRTPRSPTPISAPVPALCVTTMKPTSTTLAEAGETDACGHDPAGCIGHGQPRTENEDDYTERSRKIENGPEEQRGLNLPELFERALEVEHGADAIDKLITLKLKMDGAPREAGLQRGPPRVPDAVPADAEDRRIQGHE